MSVSYTIWWHCFQLLYFSHKIAPKSQIDSLFLPITHQPLFLSLLCNFAHSISISLADIIESDFSIREFLNPSLSSAVSLALYWITTPRWAHHNWWSKKLKGFDGWLKGKILLVVGHPSQDQAAHDYLTGTLKPARQKQWAHRCLSSAKALRCLS